jgi:hypothetical protein
MEVEAALPDCHHLGRCCQFTQFCDPRIVAGAGVMRMHPYGGINGVMAFSDFYRQPISVNRAYRADRNDRRNTGEARPCDYPFNIVAQTRVCKMAVRVDDIHEVERCEGVSTSGSG